MSEVRRSNPEARMAEIASARRGIQFWIIFLVVVVAIELTVILVAPRWFGLVRGSHWGALVGLAYHVGRYRALKRQP